MSINETRQLSLDGGLVIWHQASHPMQPRDANCKSLFMVGTTETVVQASERQVSI